MSKRKEIFRKLFTLLMVAVMVVPLAGPAMLVEADAKVTQEQIDALKDKASSLATQKKDIQAQLKAIRADKSKVMDQKELLEDQIDVINAEIGNIDDQISQYNTLIAQKEVELVENQQKQDDQFDLFCRRMRMMEEEGETSYWSILFSSDDFADLLDNYMMIEEIIEYDNGIMDSLLAIRAKIQEDKAVMEESKAAQEEARKAQEAAKAELAAQEAEVDKLIRDISAQEDVLEAAEAALKKQANAVDAEIRAKEKAMQSQIANVPSESGYLWPLPAGYNTLSSLFAGRRHPITGKYHSHTGIDVPAPKNTPIYAAKSGVVTTSIKKGSYGNYVVVSHSDGTSTLYAHMNSRAVKEGQTVKQGQVIGYVGTTGSSTGNHLHFEVRVNGTRKNPTDFFKDKTLYVTSDGKKAVLSH